MVSARTIELMGLGFDLVGLALLLSPDIPWLGFLVKLFPSVRTLEAGVAGIKTQCEARGYSLDKETRWASRGQHLLKDISFVEARPLIGLFPKGYRPPTSDKGILGDFTPFIADAILLEEQGVIRNDPFVCIGDDFGGCTQAMRLSALIQKKEDAVRKTAYSHGFALMALATLLLMLAAWVR
jgi:hypothetical protein